MKFSFFVPGIPATAGSKIGFVNRKTGKVIMVPANKKQKPWMSHVRACAIEAFGGEPLLCAIRLFCYFKLPRPKSHMRTGRYEGTIKDSAPEYPTVKPDLTKMVRAVEDALTGVIWHDDSQVVSQKTIKFYTLDKPGVEIEVEILNRNAI